MNLSVNLFKPASSFLEFTNLNNLLSSFKAPVKFMALSLKLVWVLPRRAKNRLRVVIIFRSHKLEKKHLCNHAYEYGYVYNLKDDITLNMIFNWKGPQQSRNQLVIRNEALCCSRDRFPIIWLTPTVLAFKHLIHK